VLGAGRRGGRARIHDVVTLPKLDAGAAARSRSSAERAASRTLTSCALLQAYARKRKPNREHRCAERTQRDPSCTFRTAHC